MRRRQLKCERKIRKRKNERERRSRKKGIRGRYID